jgi:Family of unknown function (DUF6464)
MEQGKFVLIGILGAVGIAALFQLAMMLLKAIGAAWLMLICIATYYLIRAISRFPQFRKQVVQKRSFDVDPIHSSQLVPLYSRHNQDLTNDYPSWETTNRLDESSSFRYPSCDFDLSEEEIYELLYAGNTSFIGDLSCEYNAHSAFLRCAVNPSADTCENCHHYESST